MATFHDPRFTVEPQTARESIPFLVKGQRGAEWLLVRNQRNPEQLYSVRTSRAEGSRSGNDAIGGQAWFHVNTEGVIAPLSRLA